VSQQTGKRPGVAIRNLSKTYTTQRGPVLALDNVSLDIASGEFLVLLGPSGCGKTTLLRCIAGLEVPDGGDVIVDGKVVFSSVDRISVAPESRHLSMVFQSYALWPHMTVFDNIAYPLRNARVSSSETRERVLAVLKVVNLEVYAAVYPGQLSGGQQQRVALARAIVSDNGIVLFDEPLSNLDARVRERLRVELLALQRDIGFTALYVTHDQVEAIALADRMVVMNVGEIAQVGSPLTVYERPRSRYVAEFVGAANEVVGVVSATGDGFCCVETSVGPMMGRAGSEPSLAVGQQAAVLFRPEHCRIASEHAPGMNSLVGALKRSMFMGGYVEHLVGTGDSLVTVRSMGTGLIAEGTPVTVSVDAGRVLVFAAN
jgi:iron(III) transport system ATP-binding protein